MTTQQPHGGQAPSDETERLRELLLGHPDVRTYVGQLVASAAEQLRTDTATLRNERRISCSFTLDGPEQPVTIAASDALAEKVDEADYLIEGPCLDALSSGAHVVVRDIEAQTPWPAYREAVTPLGIRSVMSIPVRLARETNAVMNFYATTPNAFDDMTAETGTVLATQAGEALLLALRMADEGEPSTDEPGEEPAGTVTVGLIADPVAGPSRVAEHLASDLPDLLADQVDESSTWVVEVDREQLPPSDKNHNLILDMAEERMQQRGWDLVVCVTDLVLRTNGKPIVADLNEERRAVVVSLPAFGGMSMRRRVRNVVAQLVADMRSPGTPGEGSEQHRRRRLKVLSNRFRRVTPEQADIDVRIVASRGGLRLLIGMVRDNRPWRLVFGLTGPLVGAFAFSAFYLVSTAVWELGTTMGPVRLLAAALGSMVVMVAWLTAYHHIWEPIGKRPRGERDEARLFNASTVLTLAIGVICMFAGLFVVNLLAGLVVLTPEVFGQYVTPPVGFLDYAGATTLVTAAATVAGAIGAGFDSEDSIREAAFSYRENERRQAFDDMQEQREQQGGTKDSAES